MNTDNRKITLAEGGGGAASARLIDAEIVSRFGKKGPLAGLPDAARLPEGIVFSTDSFVVTPRFFPGGDVGKLAVCGTVNDILVSGGIPKYISLALILEEGLPREELAKILDSIEKTAGLCDVSVVTGDTKVVPKGSVDGIFINTAGIGFARKGISTGRERLEAGDRILVSGTIGDHGSAILASRHGIKGKNIVSDCAPLTSFVNSAFEIAGNDVKFMRDPTRGGTGAVLKEILNNSQCGAELDETAIPVSEGTRTLCSMTGIDPLFVPCEGRVVAVAAQGSYEKLLDAWRHLPGGENASCIGILNNAAGEITLRGKWGGSNLLILPEGDPLPRIC